MMRSPVRRAATAAIDIKAAAEDRGDVETHPSMMPGDDSDGRSIDRRAVLVLVLKRIA
jgi:hypothetical protein